MVLPLDDFEVILSLEFFIFANVLVMLHLHKMLIMDKIDICFMKVVIGRQDKKPLLQSA